MGTTNNANEVFVGQVRRATSGGRVAVELRDGRLCVRGFVMGEPSSHVSGPYDAAVIVAAWPVVVVQ